MLFRKKKLKTPSGQIDTPILFPVRNIGEKSKDNTPGYTSISDLNTAMVNTMAIQEKESVFSQIEESRIHEIIDFKGVVFADSGGFDLRNSKSTPSPQKILEVQEKMNADIYATLDLPIMPGMRSEEKLKRIKTNIKSALEISKEKESDALLYASIHGHKPKTIRNSIKYLEKRGNFDGYALGGLVPIQFNYSKVFDLVLAARLATDKPLHVFGLGGLLYQHLLMYLGVDSFDSTAFIRCGSHRSYFVPGFRDHPMEDFENMEHLPCSCPVCSQNSLSEIKKDRNLVTKHNLWVLVTEMRRFKWAVEVGKDVEKYLDSRFQGNRVTKKAFQLAKQKVRRLT